MSVAVLTCQPVVFSYSGRAGIFLVLAYLRHFPIPLYCEMVAGNQLSGTVVILEAEECFRFRTSINQRRIVDAIRIYRSLFAP